MNIETLINTTLANTIDPLTKRSCLELGIKPTITLDSVSYTHLTLPTN